MNPYPLASLNHFTTPVSRILGLLGSTDLDRGPTQPAPPIARHVTKSQNRGSRAFFEDLAQGRELREGKIGGGKSRREGAPTGVQPRRRHLPVIGRPPLLRLPEAPDEGLVELLERGLRPRLAPESVEAPRRGVDAPPLDLHGRESSRVEADERVEHVEEDDAVARHRNQG